MRRFALMVAAALVVAAPLVATPATDTFAAAKAKKKAAPAEENGSLFRAFSDQLSGQGATEPKSKSKRKARRRSQ